MRRLLLTIVAAAATPAALCAQTAASSDAALVRQIVREIAEVKGGTTPTEWLQAHGEERLQVFNGPQYANDTQNWCARTVVAHPATTGRAWTRSVYFYDPQPPADDALPAPGASGKEVLEATCQLGLVWIDIPEGNPTVGTNLSESIQAALASQYASGLTTSPFGPGGFGSAGWTATRQWSVNGAALTVAYDQFKGKPHRTLVRLAFANSDAVHDLVKETQRTHIALIAQIAELVRKVNEAGMPATVTAEMTDLLEKPDYFSGENRPSETQVVAALRDWLTAAKPRPAGQQAMALLTADRVLDFLIHNAVSVGEAGQAAMKNLGADYVHDELAGGEVYAHGLLKKAKAIAPPGYSADEVLLFQMERGFDETGMCSAGAEEFKQVIQQGESLLAGARTLPASTLTSLHFIVGDGYATIVWLAKTTDSEYHDPKEYQPMAESARAKALEHYRAALSLEHGTPRAQKAWKEAWRLTSGLPPTVGRYFCVYD
jgi:hypothetical protein